MTFLLPMLSLVIHTQEEVFNLLIDMGEKSVANQWHCSLNNFFIVALLTLLSSLNLDVLVTVTHLKLVSMLSKFQNQTSLFSRPPLRLVEMDVNQLTVMG